MTLLYPRNTDLDDPYLSDPYIDDEEDDDDFYPYEGEDDDIEDDLWDDEP